MLEGSLDEGNFVALDGYGSIEMEAPADDVPEPALTVLFGLGLAATVRARRRT